MRSIGLISNPDSRRNRRAMPTIRRLLASCTNVVHLEARTPDEISTGLQKLAGNPPDILAINGGDGTVQAALTCLFNQQLFASPPLLALVPGGNTNMTARDAGLRGSVTQSVRRLCRWAATDRQAPEIVRRPILRVQSGSDSPPRYGMFFGAGLIVRGIQYCHRNVYTLGLNDELAPGLATVRLLIAIARRDPDFVTPISVGIGANGVPPTPDRDCLLLLVSTLERLFLGIHPFWGTGGGALHFTLVRGSPAHPMRAFPALLRGRPNRYGTREAGYESENLTNLQLRMDGFFTLDGELYQASRDDGPVTINHTNPVEFLRL